MLDHKAHNERATPDLSGMEIIYEPKDGDPIRQRALDTWAELSPLRPACTKSNSGPDSWHIFLISEKNRQIYCAYNLSMADGSMPSAYDIILHAATDLFAGMPSYDEFKEFVEFIPDMSKENQARRSEWRRTMQGYIDGDADLIGMLWKSPFDGPAPTGNPTGNPNGVYTPEEMADYFKLDTRALYRMEQSGEFPKSVKFSTRMRCYSMSKVNAWCAERGIPAPTEALAA